MVLALPEAEEEISVTSAAALSNKLLQLANGALYDEDHNVHEIHNCKIEAFMELIESLQGKPALVFCNYQHDRDRILKALKDSGLRVRELKTTQDEDDWNNREIDILLTHPASSAYGLNLQQIPNGTMNINADTFFPGAHRTQIRKMLKFFRDSDPTAEAIHELKDWLQGRADDEKRRQKDYSAKHSEEKDQLPILEGHYQYLKTFCDDKEKREQAKKKISNCKARMRASLAGMNAAEKLSERYKSILEDTYNILP
jgi:hypothetical protein